MRSPWPMVWHAAASNVNCALPRSSGAPGHNLWAPRLSSRSSLAMVWPEACWVVHGQLRHPLAVCIAAQHQAAGMAVLAEERRCCATGRACGST
jgi:hypothetical protein